MYRPLTLMLAAMLVVGCPCSLMADDVGYRGEGREHPFMSLGTYANPQPPRASNLPNNGIVLVGTLGREGRYDALVRYPEGKVERFATGQRIVELQAVLVEVTATTARLESVRGVLVLSLEMPEEVP